MDDFDAAALSREVTPARGRSGDRRQYARIAVLQRAVASGHCGAQDESGVRPRYAVAVWS